MIARRVLRPTVAAYTTWNPSDKDSSITLSGGNLTATGGINGYRAVRAVRGISTGKYYWEIPFVAANGANVSISMGVANASAALNTYIAADANGWIINPTNGYALTQAGAPPSISGYISTFSVGDIACIALDMTNGKIWFRKNNDAWASSGNPVTGTNPAFSSLTGTLYPAITLGNIGDTMTARFRADSLSYSAPSGFTAGVPTA